MTDSGLRTREQAAAFLGVRPQTLASWATSGRYSLPFVKIGRSVRYRQCDLERWVADRTMTSTGNGKDRQGD